MTPEPLAQTLDRLLAGWENECVEFKEANDNFSTSDIGKYFSALANEANLRGQTSGWLVFGVENKRRVVVGTSYRQEHERLMSLKHQIAQGVDPSTTFADIHVLAHAQGRVVLFEVPAAPRGMPIAWQRHFYARDGESLAGLDLTKLDAIRAQGSREDWSAAVCPKATLDDLDPDALREARDIFVRKYADRIPEATIRAWDDMALLGQLKLASDGKLTRAALVLLGRRTSTHHLSPFVAELSWKLEGEERAYEHFHPPFLLETSHLYRRIRNLPLTLLPQGQLLPYEVPKYDQRIVLEALHNCIAHQDWRACERVLVIERTGELEFSNAGGFFDGQPGDYVLGHRVPLSYRNRCLVEAMVNLRMMDTMGFGIRDTMFKGQASRHLPLPDFDLADPKHVTLRLAGRFIDENYSRALLALPDIGMDEIVALDRVQKHLPIDDAAARALRRRELIEGRRPNLSVSAKVAAATGRQRDYTRTRLQDDEHYRKLLTDYLRQWQQAGTRDLRDLIYPLLSPTLDDVQKEHKVHNLMTGLRRDGLIVNDGSRRYPRWRLATGHS
jgi:ATP-dependent DNA helicase RecG